MQYLQYTNISRSKLINSIGLQHNHKVIDQQLDREATGCFSCPYYGADIDGITPCLNCPNKNYKPVTRYVNEKNIFGYRSTLKVTGIKLYILLHFYGPDQRGLIKDIKTKDLLNALHCTKKTLFSTLHTLCDYGYLHSYCNGSRHGQINVMLADYTQMYLPADKGGRGYLAFNQSLLQVILSIESLNELRCCIRLLDATLGGEYYMMTRQAIAHLSYNSNLRYYFPQYVKRGIIKRAIESLDHLFIMLPGDPDDPDSLYIQLVDDYCAKNIRQKQKQANSTNIVNTITSINNILTGFNEINDCLEDIGVQNLQDSYFNTPVSGSIYNDLQQYGIDLPDIVATENQGIRYQKYRLLSLNGICIENLIALSLEYTTELVTKALAIVYNNYMQPDYPIKNFGGLMRQTIKNLIPYRSIA